MRRYEGFLRGSAAVSRNPPRIMVVAAQVRQSSTTSACGVRSSALECWTARYLSVHSSRCTDRAHYHGRTTGEFWQLLRSLTARGAPLYLISPRALLAWQVLGLWEQLESGNVELSVAQGDRESPACARAYGRSSGLLLVGDPPSAVRFRAGDEHGSCLWVCAGNFGLQPLSAGRDADDECRELSDAVAAATAVMDQHRLGTWGATAGSMAFSAWRKSYDGPPIYLSSGRSGCPLESRAVAGGLLLARNTGDDPVTAIAVDARSMYGWIAAHYPQAVGLAARHKSSAEAEEAVRDHPLACLAEVEVKCDRPKYPHRGERGVSYPTGAFRATLCGPELEEAMRGGAVISIHCCNRYRLGLPIAEYERHCWTARQDCESDRLRSAAPLIKRLGVALIGKFIQRVERWQECTPGLNDPLWGSWTEYEMNGTPRQWRARAGIVECQSGAELSAQAVPSIPLWIWSWGRRRMWHWIEIAGVEDVYYADTDGLVLSPLGFQRLERAGLVYDGSWGMLRHVAGPCQCRVFGPKHFQLGERVVHAGHPVAARRQDSGVGESAWYRLPWDELQNPEWSGSWVERVR